MKSLKSWSRKEHHIIWGWFLNHHHPEVWPWHAEIWWRIQGFTHPHVINPKYFWAACITTNRCYVMMWPIGSLHQLSRGKPSIPTTGLSPPPVFRWSEIPEIWAPKTSFCIKSLCFLGWFRWRWWFRIPDNVGGENRLLVKGTTNTQDWAWQAVKSI